MSQFRFSILKEIGFMLNFVIEKSDKIEQIEFLCNKRHLPFFILRLFEHKNVTFFWAKLTDEWNKKRKHLF